MKLLHWLLPLALVVGACTDADPPPRDGTAIAGDGGGDDDDDAAVDPIHDAGDAGQVACTVTGDGGIYTQCCVFGAPDPCGDGMACYWNWDFQASAASGVCFPIGAADIGAPCNLDNNACIPGAFCAWDDATPETGSGTCRRLCEVASPSTCETGEVCDTSLGGAGDVGVCMPTAVAS